MQKTAPANLWTVSMDTNMLMCHYEHLGYEMGNNQCNNILTEKFRNLIDKNAMHLVISKKAKSEFENFIINQFPEIASKTKYGNPASRKEKKININHDKQSPESLLNRIHDSLESEFISCDTPDNSFRKDMKNKFRKYFDENYTRFPTSEKSKNYLKRKRKMFLKKFGGNIDDHDGNVRKLNYLKSRMRDDHTILIDALFHVMTNPGMTMFFISGDADHVIFSKYLVKKTNRKLFVIEKTERGYDNMKSIVER